MIKYLDKFAKMNQINFGVYFKIKLAERSGLAK